MKCVVIGLGIQGKKRLSVAGKNVVGTVDPVSSEAQYSSIEQVPLTTYEAAFVCVPDHVKIPILQYLLLHKKHVLVEKPLIAEKQSELIQLKKLAQKNKVTCYTAYNHRFEPHIVRLHDILKAKKLGKIYVAKFFYGNGTSQDVKKSPWRDQAMGVLTDLGSHLLDWTIYLFGKPKTTPCLWNKKAFETCAPDYVHFGFQDGMILDYEITLLSWRNTFRADIYGEFGSAHIDCLCKWGPSTWTLRRRVFPSGRPDEESQTIMNLDPTWKFEYQYFQSLCRKGESNIENDLWINSVFHQLKKQD